MTLEQIDPIDSHTRLVGLLGWSGQPWSSLEIFNAAFHARKMDWRCVPLPVQKTKLREALCGLQALGFAGATLTEPHQTRALDFLEEYSLAAETIGAVDFVKLDKRGCLVGDNIRWLGFLATLRTVVPSLNRLRPLVIGAGTTARSVVYALTREGLPLTIVNEQMDQAVDLVHRLRHVMDEHSFSVYRWPQDLARAARGANFVINATETGAWPKVNHSPWPDDLSFLPGTLVFDLVAWPGETRFLRQAQAGGVKAIGGLSLVIYEAALAFEKWTGQPAPVEVMWQVAGDAMTQGASKESPAAPGVLEGSTPLLQPT